MDQIGAVADRALKSLRAYYERTENRDLLGGEGKVMLAITFKKIPQATTGQPQFVQQPHSALQDTSNVCLIVRDGAEEEAKRRMEEQGIRLARIVGSREFEAECRAFEHRRALLGCYDAMLTDASIVRLLSKALGKRFYKARKLPVPVDVASLTEQKIREYAGSVMYRIPSGTYMSVDVGALLQHSEAQLIDNISATLDAVRAAHPAEIDFADNIQTIGVRLSETPVLPLFTAAE